MADVKYTEEHEWIQVEGDVALIGITDYAQEQLGDVVFVELPKVGAALNKSDEASVVESVKAAAEIYAPFDGEIVEVNGALEDNPGLVNSDAEGGGWFFKLKISDAAQLEGLLDADAYAKFLESLG
ncbi:MAG: glycine cleavage system protein GcvH [Rhodospirillales bacterium]|jgi:glycine cleavage system H protein|nr:glycine cleavage system protein H [Rhodospirillaceae bacterium]MDP6429603.1 glycine cleavage system protein GcvH [Rhodospirillales bacterium]MDP6643900.1 glycine cleavage system protein GcvH [Rhodospirillales bacterium]MDP6841789.1 glycine cleavage system protein GcvH [Rhodospirillales bacterium]|tara:strand:+ start:190 stop:567 length:378 start_codon:yes stop_codon:yes gene_type:complete